AADGARILMYHWVDWRAGDRLRTWGLTPDRFEAQMDALAEGGYRVLRLDEILDIVRGTLPVPAKAVALTFDDGYRSLLKFVIPVLQRHRFPATFFLVSVRVGGANAWDAGYGDTPRDLLDWREAASLAAAGFEIGSHGRSHRILTSLSPAEREAEIRGSKVRIEDELGISVRFFSYPHGAQDERCRSLVASAGYAAACAGAPGETPPGSDPSEPRRATIPCHESSWSFALKSRTGLGIREWLSRRIPSRRSDFAPGVPAEAP